MLVDANFALGDPDDPYRLFDADFDHAPSFVAAGGTPFPKARRVAIPPQFYGTARGFADVAALNDRMVALVGSYDVAGVAAVADPKCEQLTAAELLRLAAAGVSAIACSPRAQGHFADDALMIRHVEAIASCGLTVVVHTSPYSTNASLWRILNLCERVPDAQVVVLGALASWDDVGLLATRMARLPNVAFDISGLGHSFYLSQLVGALGAERLLFGSGAARDRGGRLLQTITAAALDGADRQNILGGNAARIFRLEQRP